VTTAEAMLIQQTYDLMTPDEKASLNPMQEQLVREAFNQVKYAGWSLLDKMCGYD
jgi:hypothetical protein